MILIETVLAWNDTYLDWEESLPTSTLTGQGKALQFYGSPKIRL